MAGKRTPEAEATLLELLELGLGFESAAPVIGWTTEGLRKWRRDDEEFEERCQAAIGNGKRRVVGKLLELVERGNLGAICFWLKTRTEEFREEKQKPPEFVESPADTWMRHLDRVRASTPLPKNGTNGHANGSGHSHN